MIKQTIIISIDEISKAAQANCNVGASYFEFSESQTGEYQFSKLVHIKISKEFQSFLDSFDINEPLKSKCRIFLEKNNIFTIEDLKTFNCPSNTAAVIKTTIDFFKINIKKSKK
jgi:hypothetical protein